MIYRGSYTCPTCHINFAWVYKSADASTHIGLYDVDDFADTDASIHMKNNSNIGSETTLRGKCRCGMDVSFRYNLDSRQILPD